MKTLFAVAGLLFIAAEAFPQWDVEEVNVGFSLPPVTLLDVEPDVDNSVFFSVIPSGASGASPEIENNSGKALWLNYSSALGNGSSSRSIVAQISGAELPQGIILSLEAAPYAGTGRGTFGQTAGKVTLSGQPREILTGVGNCFTGDGEGNGHRLTFYLEIDDYSAISQAGDMVFTILYTISDH